MKNVKARMRNEGMRSGWAVPFVHRVHPVHDFHGIVATQAE